MWQSISRYKIMTWALLTFVQHLGISFRSIVTQSWSGTHINADTISLAYLYLSPTQFHLLFKPLHALFFKLFEPDQTITYIFHQWDKIFGPCYWKIVNRVLIASPNSPSSHLKKTQAVYCPAIIEMSLYWMFHAPI